MSNTEYTLVFGLGPKADGTPNTGVDSAIAIAALEDASLKGCGGFTLHRGNGGWMDPANKIVSAEVRKHAKKLAPKIISWTPLLPL